VHRADISITGALQHWGKYKPPSRGVISGGGRFGILFPLAASGYNEDDDAGAAGVAGTDRPNTYAAKADAV
jgi:hypothetical protein